MNVYWSAIVNGIILYYTKQIREVDKWQNLISV